MSNQSFEVKHNKKSHIEPVRIFDETKSSRRKVHLTWGGGNLKHNFLQAGLLVNGIVSRTYFGADDFVAYFIQYYLVMFARFELARESNRFGGPVVDGPILKYSSRKKSSEYET